MSAVARSPFVVRLERRFLRFAATILFVIGGVFLGVALFSGGDGARNEMSVCFDHGKDPGADSYGKLTFDTQSGGSVFHVEIMTSPCRLARGLMSRRSLEADWGMAFSLGSLQPAAMWMKDTLIPLDMIFVANGKVVSVSADQVPLSEKMVVSREPVDLVVEVNAGMARKFGIVAGTSVKLGAQKSEF